MKQAKLTFSNGDTLILQEGDVLVSVHSFECDGNPYTSINSTVTLENHMHDGLIPSIMEIVCNNPFFYGPGRTDVIYNSSAIVKIENV